MNLFKKCPHMFANGKFQVRFETEGTGINEPLKSEVTSKIIGYNKDRILVLGHNLLLERCTLIARPISSLTDEELKKLDAIKKDILSLCSGTVNGSDMIYLLSIGVYPGPQSDFEDGTIIKANG